MSHSAKFSAAIALWLLLVTCGLARTSLPTGPSAPSQPSLSFPKKGEDMVINPTVEQCRLGWHSGLRWTKIQFDGFCIQLETSK